MSTLDRRVSTLEQASAKTEVVSYIILWSTVQVCHALPFKSTTYEPLMFCIRGFCLFRLHIDYESDHAHRVTYPTPGVGQPPHRAYICLVSYTDQGVELVNQPISS